MCSRSTFTEGRPPLRRLPLVLALAALSMPAAMAGAFAQGVFERLVMPGPLIEGHAKLEEKCASCHEAFKKAAQAGLCMSCHKDVAADRLKKRGYHGLRPDARVADCKTCHTDHKGRGFNIVQLDREAFNHAQTNFALAGAHQGVACARCHAPDQRFRAAETACAACHAKADPHKGRLGDKCDGCHSEQSWRQTKPFDHSRTRFALEGSHAKVACAACHAGETYKGTAQTCVACHAIQDAHQGSRGTKCETCHTPKTWKAPRFDHAKATRFPLLGAHASVKCESCHVGGVQGAKPSTACVACHANSDPHKGQLGQQCARCHNETGWRRKVAFDHDLTRFPLVGLHATVTCESCHRSASFKDASRACQSCHQDRHHAGRLGAACALCHNPNGWQRWRFEHDRQTRFPLTGAHKGLDCHACHRASGGTRVVLETGCFGCHAADDAHQGSFGRSCETCHSTASFRAKGLGR